MMAAFPAPSNHAGSISPFAAAAQAPPRFAGVSRKSLHLTTLIGAWYLRTRSIISPKTSYITGHLTHQAARFDFVGA